MKVITCDNVTFDMSVCQSEHTEIKRHGETSLALKAPIFECCPNVYIQGFYDLAWTHGHLLVLYSGRNSNPSLDETK